MNFRTVVTLHPDKRILHRLKPVASGYGQKPDRSAIRPIKPPSPTGRGLGRAKRGVGDRFNKHFIFIHTPSCWPPRLWLPASLYRLHPCRRPGGRRNPSFNNRVGIMLNAFSIHPDLSPKGEGFTDPLIGDSKENYIKILLFSYPTSFMPRPNCRTRANRFCSTKSE